MNNEITAIRIKELREKKHLSHKGLSENLKAKHNISVTDKQLINYEAAAKIHHSKENVVAGMAIKTLYAIAQEFNVSTDYLLGISDIATPETNLRAVCEYTGLSENAVKFLHEINETSKLPMFSTDSSIEFCSYLFEEGRIYDFTSKVNDFISFYSRSITDYKNYLNDIDGDEVIDFADLNETKAKLSRVEAKELFENIFDEYTKKEKLQKLNDELKRQAIYKLNIKVKGVDNNADNTEA